MEMVVTMLIIMILSTISVAGYNVYQRESPVRFAADRLSHAMAAARAYAVANNAVYTVKIDPNYQTYWIDESDDLGGTVVPKVTSPVPIGERVTLVGVNFGVTPLTTSTQTGLPIRFFPDGSCDDARLTLRQGDAASGIYYAVRVYGPTGLSLIQSNVAPTTGSLVMINIPAPQPSPTPVVTPLGSMMNVRQVRANAIPSANNNSRYSPAQRGGARR